MWGRGEGRWLKSVGGGVGELGRKDPPCPPRRRNRVVVSLRHPVSSEHENTTPT